MAPWSNNRRQSNPVSRAARMGHDNASVSAQAAASRRVAPGIDQLDQEAVRSSVALSPAIQNTSSTGPSRPAASRRPAGASSAAATHVVWIHERETPAINHPAATLNVASICSVRVMSGLSPIWSAAMAITDRSAAIFVARSKASGGRGAV
jgi:hypothetical protein